MALGCLSPGRRHAKEGERKEGGRGVGVQNESAVVARRVGDGCRGREAGVLLSFVSLEKR